MRIPLLALLRLAREALQQLLDLAVLLALAVGPFPDHLLLGAHMRDQTLDRFCEVGHRRGGAAAAAAALLERGAQPVDRALQLAAPPPPRPRRASAENSAPGGGEPVLQIGIEPVLRLARLQIQEAEDQRACE